MINDGETIVLRLGRRPAAIARQIRSWKLKSTKVIKTQLHIAIADVGCHGAVRLIMWEACYARVELL